MSEKISVLFDNNCDAVLEIAKGKYSSVMILGVAKEGVEDDPEPMFTCNLSLSEMVWLCEKFKFACLHQTVGRDEHE